MAHHKSGQHPEDSEPMDQLGSCTDAALQTKDNDVTRSSLHAVEQRIPTYWFAYWGNCLTVTHRFPLLWQQQTLTERRWCWSIMVQMSTSRSHLLMTDTSTTVLAVSYKTSCSRIRRGGLITHLDSLLMRLPAESGTFQFWLNTNSGTFAPWLRMREIICWSINLTPVNDMHWRATC